MKWLRGSTGRSVIQNGLWFARTSPSVYKKLSGLWFHAFNASSKLLRSHSLPEFKKLIRPVLLPNESLSDIEQRGWDKTNNLFQFWLRNQYLEKRYKDTETFYNATKHLEALSTIPTLSDLCEIFTLKDWKYKPSTEKRSTEVNLEKQILSKITTRDKRSTKNLSFEEILEIAGCAVMGRNEFNVYCEENKIFEFYTAEYVDKLGAYLRERSMKIAKEQNKDQITILEVGAGSGILGHFLRHKSPLSRHLPSSKASVIIDYIATDSGRSGLHTNKEIEVIKEKYSSALSKAQPDIIVCSWMPMDEDWSVFFRQFSSVCEYVLIGEFYDGCCGHNWFTWGNSMDKPPEDAPMPAHYLRLVSNIAPYEKDNYEKVFLKTLSSIQYSRYDSRYFRGNSATFSFRKNLSASRK